MSEPDVPPDNPDRIDVVAWFMIDPAVSVWFLLCPDPELGFVVRIRTRPTFQVDGHHLSGGYMDTAVNWTERMERDGLTLKGGRYVYAVDRQRLLALQHQLATQSSQLDEDGGLAQSVLDEVLEWGEVEQW